MDPQDVIAMALEVVLESERQKKRQSEESLWALQVALGEKQRERSMLTRKKQRLLEKQAIEENLVDDFMVFIEAIENNDLQIAQNFDENETMNAIVAMLNSNGGDNRGFSHDNEGIHSKLENAQNLAASRGTNNDGCEGSDAGGNGGDEWFNNELENAQNSSAPEVGAKDDGSEGSSAPGNGETKD